MSKRETPRGGKGKVEIPVASNPPPTARSNSKTNVKLQQSDEDLAVEKAKLFGSSTATRKATVKQQEDEAKLEDLALENFTLDLDGIETVATDEVDFEEIDDELAKFAEDQLVKDALEKGIDLRQYAQEIDHELRDVEKASIGDYIHESENLAALHTQIRNCDQILEKMEKLLSGFQADLGDISSEIKTLQEESLSMNVRLTNRKETETRLGGFLEQLVVPPNLIQSICEADPIDESYLDYVLALKQRIDYAKRPEVIGSLASKEAQPELEKLKLKAVSRIREFLMTKINSLKKPKTNIQILQQNVLVKYRIFIDFLDSNHPEVANEIKAAYLETMSKMYYGHFKTYITNLSKLQYDIATKNDLIGSEDRERGLFGGRKDLQNKGAVFSLNNRDQVLQEIDQDPIIYHVAVQKGLKFPYECILRSSHKLLMDTATSEYLFCLDFFGIRDTDMFMLIFTKTISWFLESLENALYNCYDTVGLLLMIRVTFHHNLIMQRRRIPCLDAFFDRVKMMLWPRFKTVLDMNIESLRRANPRTLASQDVHPHYITRRFAEFSASIHKLNLNYNDEIIANSLTQLRTPMERLLERLAQEATPSPKLRTVFLINNFDLILTLFHDQQVNSEDTRAFEELFNHQIAMYVEVELQDTYGALISFVKDTEAALARAPSDNPPRLNNTAVELLVQNFADGWKQGIEQINADVMNQFSNFRNGMEILKQVLTQLLLYYTRFQEILKRCYKGQPPFQNNLISVHTIMYEIKKYSKNF